MHTPHKHKEAIIAWANGKTIQYRYKNFDWSDMDFESPMWLDDHEYRVKPEIHIVKTYLYFDAKCPEYINQISKGVPNIRLVFENDKLISAEVIK